MCRLNRTLRAAAAPGSSGARLAQGRPLGVLLAWLSAPHTAPEAFPDRQSHKDLGGAAERGNPLISYDVRTELREWAETLPELHTFFERDLERERRPGEGPEPSEAP